MLFLEEFRAWLLQMCRSNDGEVCVCACLPVLDDAPQTFYAEAQARLQYLRALADEKTVLSDKVMTTHIGTMTDCLTRLIIPIATDLAPLPSQNIARLHKLALGVFRRGVCGLVCGMLSSAASSLSTDEIRWPKDETLKKFLLDKFTGQCAAYLIWSNSSNKVLSFLPDSLFVFAY